MILSKCYRKICSMTAAAADLLNFFSILRNVLIELVVVVVAALSDIKFYGNFEIFFLQKLF